MEYWSDGVVEYCVGTGNRGSSFAVASADRCYTDGHRLFTPVHGKLGERSPFMVHRAWFMENGEQKVSRRIHGLDIDGRTGVRYTERLEDSC